MLSLNAATPRAVSAAKMSVGYAGHLQEFCRVLQLLARSGTLRLGGARGLVRLPQLLIS